MGWRYVSRDGWIVGGGLDHRVGQVRWVGLRTFQLLLYSNAHLPGVIAADETSEACSFVFDVTAHAHRMEEGDGVCAVLGGTLLMQDHVVGVEGSGR